MLSQSAIMRGLLELKRWNAYASFKILLQRRWPVQISRESIWLAIRTGSTLQWNSLTATWWRFTNKILSKRLYSLIFVSLKNHLLSSRLGESQFLAIPKSLPSILVSLLANLLWLKLGQPTKIRVWGRLRWHGWMVEMQPRIKAHLPGMRAGFLKPLCWRVSRTSSCSF